MPWPLRKRAKVQNFHRVNRMGWITDAHDTFIEDLADIDQGFGITQKEIDRISKRFEGNEEAFTRALGKLGDIELKEAIKGGGLLRTLEKAAFSEEVKLSEKIPAIQNQVLPDNKAFN